MRSGWNIWFGKTLCAQRCRHKHWHYSTDVVTVLLHVQVLNILKEIIRDEGMFDHRNPVIILCGGELEKALNMKALHVTELRFVMPFLCFLHMYLLPT
jgi:hypothetical protein